MFCDARHASKNKYSSKVLYFSTVRLIALCAQSPATMRALGPYAILLSRVTRYLAVYSKKEYHSSIARNPYASTIQNNNI